MGTLSPLPGVGYLVLKLERIQTAGKAATERSMSVASFLRLVCLPAQAGSGTLRAYRPLTYLLQPASLQHPGCRNSFCYSSISHRRITSSSSRGNGSSRGRVPPAAATTSTPTLVASQDDQLEWDEAKDEPDSQQFLVLPPPSHSRVKTADFVKSSTEVSQCPPSKHPEFAVIGRSNVGKSSLINMLTGRKALAQISKTPGQTSSCVADACSGFIQAKLHPKQTVMPVQVKQNA